MIRIWDATRPEHFRDALVLIEELAQWDAEESRRAGLDGSAVVEFFYPGKTEEIIAHDSMAPDGCLALASFESAVVGCGAFRRLDASTCELLHVYVRSEYRGQGIARRIVERLVSAAASVGYESVRLETATFMTRALNLYASMGFTQRHFYREVPIEFLPFTICMELPLNRFHMK